MTCLDLSERTSRPRCGPERHRFYKENIENQYKIKVNPKTKKSLRFSARLLRLLRLMAALLVDVVDMDFEGRTMPFVRMAGGEGGEGGAPSGDQGASSEDVFLLNTQVYKQLMEGSSLTLKSWLISMGRLLDRENMRDAKCSCSKEQMRFFKDVGLLSPTAGMAQLTSAAAVHKLLLHLGLGSMARAFKAHVLEPQFEPLVDQQVAVVRRRVQEAASGVVLLPETPEEVAFEVTPEMLKMKSYTIRHADLQGPQCKLLLSQTASFTAWLEKGVVLSRESGALKQTTSRDHLKKVLRAMGFASRFCGKSLDLRQLANGLVIAKLVKLLAARRQNGAGASKSLGYSIQVLAGLSKLMKWLQSYCPQTSEGYQKLEAQILTYKHQLRALSQPAKLDVLGLIANGSAITYDELSQHVGVFSEEVLKECSEGPLTLQLARKVRDVVLLGFYISLPPQRQPAIASMQIGMCQADLHRQDGNRCLLQGETWVVCFQEHKNDKTTSLPAVRLPPDCHLAQGLSQFLLWAEDLLLDDYGLPSTDQTNGCMFLNSHGKPYASGQYYSKFVSLVQEVCHNQDLRVGPQLVRKLVADSGAIDDQDEAVRHSLAQLGGHSLHTQLASYRSVPQQHLTTLALSNAVAAMHRRKRGRPTKRVLADPTKLLSPQDFSPESGRAAYFELYGAHTTSGNMPWLFSKVTGLEASQYRLHKRARSASRSRSASQEEAEEASAGSWDSGK